MENNDKQLKNIHDIYTLYKLYANQNIVDEFLGEYPSLDSEVFEIFICHKCYAAEEEVTLEDVKALYPDYIVKYKGQTSSFYFNGEPVLESYIEEEEWYEDYVYITNIASNYTTVQDTMNAIIDDDDSYPTEILSVFERWLTDHFNNIDSKTDNKVLRETIVHIATLVVPSGTININYNSKDPTSNTIVTDINQFGDMMLHFKEQQAKISLKEGVSIATKKELLLVKVYAVYDQNSGRLVKFELQLINDHDDKNLILQEALTESLEEESTKN